MSTIEPVPDEPAAIATIDGDRTLLIADYHAGVEAALRYERGVQVPSQAESRRERLRHLIDRTGATRLVVLGDLMHSIGDPGGAERGELEVLFESLPSISVTLVKGNHDGAIESWIEDAIAEGGRGPPGATDGVTEFEVLPGSGGRLGSVGVCHGHSWPAATALTGEVLCLGHEHPCVRLEDDVGGSRVEPIWLRGELDRAWIAERAREAAPPNANADGVAYDDVGDPGAANDASPRLVVLPAFNELVGGTWVNVEGRSFLSPMLPGGLANGEAYLLDGTRLGPYESV